MSNVGYSNTFLSKGKIKSVNWGEKQKNVKYDLTKPRAIPKNGKVAKYVVPDPSKRPPAEAEARQKIWGNKTSKVPYSEPFEYLPSTTIGAIGSSVGGLDAERQIKKNMNNLRSIYEKNANVEQRKIDPNPPRPTIHLDPPVFKNV